jgi:hypothetical protein
MRLIKIVIITIAAVIILFFIGVYVIESFFAPQVIQILCNQSSVSTCSALICKIDRCVDHPDYSNVPGLFINECQDRCVVKYQKH